MIKRWDCDRHLRSGEHLCMTSEQFFSELWRRSSLSSFFLSQGALALARSQLVISPQSLIDI